MLTYLIILLLLLCLCASGYLIYKCLRHKYPITVNCWFCNQNQKVPYGSEQCWECLYCEQYNGFSLDGGYNKPIFAQYFKYSTAASSQANGMFRRKSPAPSNGLCVNCNRNQLLKIKQLANFVPYNEETYDSEVELYAQHLELTYALCKSCEGAVRLKLSEQDSTLRPKVFSWHLQQKRKERLSRTSRVINALRSYCMILDVPLKAQLLRLLSLNIATLLFLQATHSLEKTIPLVTNALSLENVLPEFLVEMLVELKNHEQVCSVIGFFSVICGVFISGKQRLRLIDAVCSFVWLSLLFLHVPLWVTCLEHYVDVAILRIIIYVVCFSVTTLSIFCNRTSPCYYDGSVSTKRNSSFCSLLSSASSTIAEASNEPPSLIGDSSKDRSNSAAQSSQLIQDECITTTTNTGSRDTVCSINSTGRHSCLDDDLKAMKIGTPKKLPNISGIFTPRCYSPISLSLTTDTELSHLASLRTSRSVLSPPRFSVRHVTQSSWVAGGYWATAYDSCYKKPLYGFYNKDIGSQCNISHSCPASRAGSVPIDDNDKLSVLSEPASNGELMWPASLRSRFNPYSFRNHSMERSDCSCSQCSDNSSTSSNISSISSKITRTSYHNSTNDNFNSSKSLSASSPNETNHKWLYLSMSFNILLGICILSFYFGLSINSVNL